jgi:altronate hydrolase
MEIPSKNLLQIDSRDNVAVALSPLQSGTEFHCGALHGRAALAIPAKHKMALVDLLPGDAVYLYGMVVGEATELIPCGGLLHPRNTRHRIAAYSALRQPVSYTPPDTSRWAGRTFMGFHRADGQVGTRNYWLVLPLVFCENRHVERMKEALDEELGYAADYHRYRQLVRQILSRRNASQALPAQPERLDAGLTSPSERAFPHLDGIRFLTHQGGCGGTRQDAQALCGLLAGYIHHPNVAGATVLSLGCQNAQIAMLIDELRAREAYPGKPVLIFDQQKMGSDAALMSAAIEATLAGLAEAERCRRAPAPLSALTVGLKCGGSDGFSGISANPAVGHVSDLLVGLGARTLLSEFPELHGVEQELIDRCVSDALAERFRNLMEAYADSARAAGSALEMNPSPGNIADGLITDAMKSAGAARKGGLAPIQDVLDYPAYATAPGLNLLCTPGNDAESMTAQVGAGANLVLFTTGLGAPTGNPIAPVVKIATNTALAKRMSEIVDFDAGAIVSGDATIAETAEQLLEMSIEVASGLRLTKAELLGQNDFIPWKRGVSL